MLSGKFVQAEKGIRIEAHLTLDIFILVFSVIWLVLMGGTFLLFDFGKTIETPNDFMLSPLAAIIIFYLMVLIGFGSYAKRTEKFIMNLFESYKTD